MRGLPPLKALLSFTVVSETLNVSKAAEKLFVTQSAVSQQVKILEAYLGIKLLKRKGKHIELTEEGKLYAAQIKLAFEGIMQATTHLRSNTTNAHLITVNMHTTFATRWLIPRLIDFQTEYPEYELRISTPIKQLDSLTDEIDAMIYLGNKQPGISMEYLFQDKIYPVCSPSLIKTKKGAINLIDYPLLQVSAQIRKNDWTTWLKAAKLASLKSYQIINFPTLDQALEAAIAGMGVAIGSHSLVSADIKNGNLIAPFALQIPEPNAYYLIFSSQIKTKHSIFHEWLLKQIVNLKS